MQKSQTVTATRDTFQAYNTIQTQRNI